MTTEAPWYMAGDAWTLREEGFHPDRTVYFETIFAQANGYMGVRGYAEEIQPNVPSVREGYLAGVFSEVDEEATRIIGDFPWAVLQMVSLPDPFGCALSLGDEVFDPTVGTVKAYARRLDLKSGLLTRELTWTSPGERTTRLIFERFLSAADPHLAAHRIRIAPVDWDGEARLDFRLDGTVPSVFRCGDRRQPHLPQRHYIDHAADGSGEAGRLAMTTHTTGHRVALAARLSGPGPVETVAGPRDVQQTVALTVRAGEAFDIVRFVAVATSRDMLDAPDPESAADASAGRAAEAGFDAALEAARAVWAERWAMSDVEIDGAPLDQKVVRYNIFQLLQMAPHHSERLSIPARAYAYNRYRGLYFWDTEIFLLPFYAWTQPAVARNLLAFRRHTLPGAHGNAQHWGGRGAFYPWMTDSDTGLDNSIDARIWKLLHQTADIAYAVDAFADASGDLDFMAEHGGRILAETARFFASRLVKDPDGSLHIEETIGPDEDVEPGRDNGFTNLMARRNLRIAAAWMGRLAAERPDALAAIRGEMDLADEEVAAWPTLADALVVPDVPGLGIPLQDEHLLSRKEADVVGWRLREEPEHWRLPPGTKRSDYQLIKQADIVLAALLLGDEFTRDEIAAIYDFYEPRTLHISSLSWNTHAIVAARLGRREQAYAYYKNSAGLDLDDVKRATEDGLHAAALGGCWQAVAFGFAGLGVDGDRLVCDPQLPPDWTGLRLRVSFRGEPWSVSIDADGKAAVERVPPGA